MFSDNFCPGEVTESPDGYSIPPFLLGVGGGAIVLLVIIIAVLGKEGFNVNYFLILQCSSTVKYCNFNETLISNEVKVICSTGIL
jgi:hypothetical protein